MSYVLSFRTALIALFAVISTFVASVFISDQRPADMRIEPIDATITIGEPITLAIVVESNQPANAFTGELVFDNTHFVVEDIRYNTSIADLWAAEPWYNRSENSIYFAGGTTKPGGFIGTGVLLQVTLRALETGDTALALSQVRILAHDGLGSDLAVQTSIDAVFTATGAVNETYIEPVSKPGVVSIVPDGQDLDINGDGKLSFQDISVLLLQLNSNDLRYDFNGDGIIDWSDVGTWQRLRE